MKHRRNFLNFHHNNCSSILEKKPNRDSKVETTAFPKALVIVCLQSTNNLNQNIETITIFDFDINC